MKSTLGYLQGNPLLLGIPALSRDSWKKQFLYTKEKERKKEKKKKEKECHDMNGRVKCKIYTQTHRKKDKHLLLWP